MMKEENKSNVFIELEKVPLKSERQEKRNKIKHVLIYTLICIALLLIGFLCGNLYTYFVHPTNKADVTNTFGEIESMLKKYWVYSNDYDDIQTELENKAFYGMTSFLEDPYTTYMSKEELEAFSNGINMDYVGIGVMYSINNDRVIVERVFANSPAEVAGILPGDIIDKVDNISVQDLSSEEIKNLVIGEENTKVIITVIRNGESIDKTCVRSSVDNSVYCYTQDDYIVMELSSFGVSTAKECMTYLNQFADYSKIIIDLRNNSGGYQTSVKEIAGLFIGNNKVYLRQKDVNGNEVADVTSCEKTYAFDKIVLLVNGETASAAEVFTICLKEQLPNVTVVGDTTYGKGVIQSTHYLSNGGVLKFTSFYWYSPNGVSIHKTGIKPDIPVRLDDIAYEMYVDMKEDEAYEYDSVGEIVKISQEALKFLDYDIERTDGYFDHSFEKALVKYKNSYGLGNNAILDLKTYQSIISSTVNYLSLGDKDYQFKKAIELVNE